MIKQFIFRFKWLMYKIQEQGEQAVATMMDVKDLLEWFYEIITLIPQHYYKYNFLST